MGPGRSPARTSKEGGAVSHLRDAVETFSSSAADTTGFMRAVDDGYIYNLKVPTNAIANDLFTIKVRPFGDGNPGSSMYVVLKIRK
jgi:hypothetical protein